jgi:hypothetical protein
MLPWSTCGHTQGLVRIAPAKQYRLQLHVTTNEKLTDDEERAHDVRNGTRGRSRSSSFGPASGSASWLALRHFSHHLNFTLILDFDQPNAKPLL